MFKVWGRPNKYLHIQKKGSRNVCWNYVTQEAWHYCGAVACRGLDGPFGMDTCHLLQQAPAEMCWRRTSSTFASSQPVAPLRWGFSCGFDLVVWWKSSYFKWIRIIKTACGRFKASVMCSWCSLSFWKPECTLAESCNLASSKLILNPYDDYG